MAADHVAWQGAFVNAGRAWPNRPQPQPVRCALKGWSRSAVPGGSLTSRQKAAGTAANAAFKLRSDGGEDGRARPAFGWAQIGRGSAGSSATGPGPMRARIGQAAVQRGHRSQSSRGRRGQAGRSELQGGGLQRHFRFCCSGGVLCRVCPRSGHGLDHVLGVAHQHGAVADQHVAARGAGVERVARNRQHLTPLIQAVRAVIRLPDLAAASTTMVARGTARL